MKVEIWSDFVCPYCYIGQKAFQRALENFEHREHVTIQYRCFQLDPEAEVHNERTVIELLMDKLQLPKERTLSKMAAIAEMGSKYDVQIQLDKINHTNTFEAHRLVKLAETYGKDSKVVEQLFETYFSQLENIGLEEVLINIAEASAIENEHVVRLLNCRKYTNAVREDQLVAEEMGVEGVPFFVFNEVHAVAGAQSEEVFLKVLQQIWDEENAEKVKLDKNAPVCATTYCDGDICYGKE